MVGLDESKLREELQNKLMRNISLESTQNQGIKNVESKEYIDFKQQYLPKNLSLYEKACQFAENTMKMSVSATEKAKLSEAIKTCHLNVTPESTASLALLVPIGIFFAFLMASFIIFGIFMQNMDAVLFFAFFALILGAGAYSPVKNLPYTLSQSWKMKASNQMVICTFYIVTYMRHTSNLENAMKFASDHIDYPLSLDLKKVIWDVETQKYDSIKTSLEDYLAKWKDFAPEFVESIHMIESSLYEGEEKRRLEALDKSLNNILEETYEKMLHYAHNLHTPLTTLNMLGVVMPILGLVLLPLMVSMMETDWYYLAAIYNILLFAAVYYMGIKILTSRPTGYGDSDISNNNGMNQFKGTNFMGMLATPKQAAFMTAIFFIIIALLPIIMYNLNPNIDASLTEIVYAYFPDMSNMNNGEIIPFLEYREADDGTMKGPFGLFASLLSLGFTLAAGIGLGTYYKLSSSNVIKIREESKKLESEFASALFQLSNRLADGLPAEIAFQRISETLQGSLAGKFFQTTSMNIQKMGMNLDQAIFDKQYGSIIAFPSSIIRSTMKVLVEAAEKGPKIAAEAMLNVSKYIKEIHKVDERLKDLMGETIASMKSQVKMLSPTISAIVVGVTSMIIAILGELGKTTDEISAEAGGAAGVISLFGDGIPTYYLQIVVGLYVVQVCYVLTIIANGIENGSDKLAEKYNLGVNLIKSTTIYTMITFVVVLAFTILAKTVVGPGGLV